MSAEIKIVVNPEWVQLLMSATTGRARNPLSVV
jgi:hypothetical protein